MKKIIVLLSALLASFNVLAVVDLNTATQSQLEEVNGIGPAKAKAIIEYRTKNGGFKTIQDLDNVPGFGRATLEKLKSEVVVGGSKVAVATGQPSVKTNRDSKQKK